MTGSEERNDSFIENEDDDKENAVSVNQNQNQYRNLKSYSVNGGSGNVLKESANLKSLSTGKALKQTSLQVCMQMNESDKGDFAFKAWDRAESEHSSSLNIWEYSDSDAAPASSWATLTNRALLCKTLPMDVGRCTCVIVKENSQEKRLHGGALYTLYTNEGRGRKDRKLAMAYHKRRNGKSEFVIAQSMKGILSHSDDGYIGTMTANLMGSKYYIWDQGLRIGPVHKQLNLLSVVIFSPTIATWTGSYRSMKALIPSHHPFYKNAKLMQKGNRLPKDWLKNAEKIQTLQSRAPHYNKNSKQYELDFRDRSRSGLRIQSSVKNFQLVLQENCRQTILQMGRVEKSKYVIDFRFPLTGFQAFCFCLASIDSKLCCTI